MEEFEGTLEYISPEKLIDMEKSKDFDNFFLVLGLIFNDLKDLLLFFDLIEKVYRVPKTDGSEPASTHLGQWGGVRDHLNRLMTGFMSEFLVFLRENKKLMNSIQFQFFVKNLPPKIKKDWNEIVNAVDNKGSNDFLSEIARIRNNVAFHYDNSLKELRKGFIDKFFTSTKNEYNKKAYYSLGNNLQTTRFYYCDAAAGGYLEEHLKFSKENSHYQEIRDLISKTNNTIRFMMEIYLKSKK